MEDVVAAFQRNTICSGVIRKHSINYNRPTDIGATTVIGMKEDVSTARTQDTNKKIVV
jgi:hypothetical protein